MSEGPQVRRRTEWLDRYLAGRTVLRCVSARADVPAESLTGRQVERAFCKGKHIFIEFQGECFLHNHLLMRGKWRKLDGNQLFLPAGAWLGLYVGPYTICNLNGQMLALARPGDVAARLASLGPDTLRRPYPAEEIRTALAATGLPIAEALLDQSLLAGVGNIAKSEILFRARLAPHVAGNQLSDEALDRLLESIRRVLWKSYADGGRWDCRVYRRHGTRCIVCGSLIRSTRLPPSQRATYYCPSCQS